MRSSHIALLLHAGLALAVPAAPPNNCNQNWCSDKVNGHCVCNLWWWSNQGLPSAHMNQSCAVANGTRDLQFQCQTHPCCESHCTYGPWGPD
ncbi:hypothetical protein BJ878DRAFT_232755 [Calycina marina]|uniref:Uncharacterized protein n=1 Tax=Calycina marina TaxID=1763456 RepID=A0A9P7Z7U0_9HELO|nr:hypothetical protein BJ878DRAFT_232755 [Calycina marina]